MAGSGEGLAEFVRLDEQTALVKGRGVFDVLKRWNWALIKDGGGIAIPEDKRSIAEAALRGAGFQILGGLARPVSDKPIGKGFPPECVNRECGQPYPHGTIVQPGQRCYGCGEPLALVQGYTTRCRGGEDCVSTDHPCRPGRDAAVLVHFRPYEQRTPAAELDLEPAEI
jgi:hypothetical protein